MNDLHKLGLGTAAIGRPLYINIRQQEKVEVDMDAFRQKGMERLELAYAQGMRYFDTAPGYGMAEQLLIDWILQKNDASIEIAGLQALVSAFNRAHQPLV